MREQIVSVLDTRSARRAMGVVVGVVLTSCGVSSGVTTEQAVVEGSQPLLTQPDTLEEARDPNAIEVLEEASSPDLTEQIVYRANPGQFELYEFTPDDGSEAEPWLIIGCVGNRLYYVANQVFPRADAFNDSGWAPTAAQVALCADATIDLDEAKPFAEELRGDLFGL